MGYADQTPVCYDMPSNIIINTKSTAIPDRQILTPYVILRCRTIANEKLPSGGDLLCTGEGMDE